MNSVKDFSFYVPLRIIFGSGSIKKLASLVSRNGKKVLLVTGKRHLKEMGKLDYILKILRGNEKIEEVVTFDDTPQNPDVKAIEKASELMKEYDLDVVIAIGGGSAMDLAKVASICAKNDKNVWDIYKDNAVNVLEAYPIICVPTTSGSGSEVTRYAVFNDNERKVKVALSSLSIYPKLSLVDPELTYTMPKNVIANTGFDALSHAIEAYTSKSSCPITDLYCKEAISIIHENLMCSFLNRSHRCMDNMSIAAMMAGLALNVGRASLPHALEHNLSAFIPELPHGLGLAIVMVPFLKRAIYCNPERFANIARLMGKNAHNKSVIKSAEMCIEAVYELIESLNLNKNLKDFGLDKKSIDIMVDENFWTMEHGIKNSPCDFTKQDIINMYYEALEGKV